MNLGEYLRDWFRRHGAVEQYDSSDDWINDMTNSDLVMWFDIYQNDKENKS